MGFIKRRKNNIPPGTYEATVNSVAQRVSSKGNPMLVVVYSLVPDGEITDHVPLHVDWKVEQLLNAVGHDSEEEEVDEQAFVGRSVCVEIVHDSYNGVSRPRVQAVLPPDHNEAA